MTEQREHWSDIDKALERWLVGEDALLAGTTRAAAAAGFPPIQVSPLGGKLLHLLARAIGARRVLEIGTLAGYSAIWMARALPVDGRLVSLELDEARAALARENIARAGLGERVEVVVGPALASLESMIERGEGLFDLTFIDADKERCAEYLDRSTGLMRPGGVIVVDNVVRSGRIIDPAQGDADSAGVRRMMEMLSQDDRLTATATQTVGVKGHDGFLLAVVAPTPRS
jgi:predicted O-methyltransferase YrrM